MLASSAFAFLASVTRLDRRALPLIIIAAFVVLMPRTNHDNNGRVSPYWWPIFVVGASFAIITIIQAPATAFFLLGGLLAFGTALYFVARRETIRTPEPDFD
jgi:hypothetical protein